MVGALFWLVAFLGNLIPEAAVAPILVFVGVSIIAVSFRSCEPKHHIAIAIAFVPHVSGIIHDAALHWPDVTNPLVWGNLLLAAILELASRFPLEQEDDIEFSLPPLHEPNGSDVTTSVGSVAQEKAAE
jgi:hypothetical protein